MAATASGGDVMGTAAAAASVGMTGVMVNGKNNGAGGEDFDAYLLPLPSSAGAATTPGTGGPGRYGISNSYTGGGNGAGNSYNMMEGKGENENNRYNLGKCHILLSLLFIHLYCYSE